MADASSNFLTGPPLIILSVAICLCSLQIILDTSIIATAIPSITSYFGTVEDVDWYGTAYLLTLCAIGPLTGQIYTIFRIKQTYLVFIFLFMLGNLISALAKTSKTLIMGRAVTGAGAAGVMTGNMVTITMATAPSLRPQLLNLSVVMVGIGGAVGPVVGGAITQHIGWRWCLWIFLPVAGTTGILITILRIPNIVAPSSAIETLRNLPRKLDIVGFFLFTPSSIMFLIAMSWGGSKYTWNSAVVIGLLVSSIIAVILFSGWISKRKERALIPPHILLQPVVSFACAVSFVQGIAFFMLSYYLPLWFQSVQSVSPQRGGVMMLPTCIAQIIAGFASGFLLKSVPYAPVWAVSGNAATAIGAGLMTTFVPSTPARSWIGYQVLTGIGRGIALQMPILAVQACLPPADTAVSVAIILFFQYFGGAIGVNIAKTVFANALTSALKRYAPDVDAQKIIQAGATDFHSTVASQDVQGVVMAYNRALTLTFWIPVAVAIVGLFLSFGLGWHKLAGGKTKKADNAEEKTDVSHGEGECQLAAAGGGK